MSFLIYFFLSTKQKIYFIIANAIIVLLCLIYTLIDGYFRSTICPTFALIVEIILIVWLFYLYKKLKKEKEERDKFASQVKDLFKEG